MLCSVPGSPLKGADGSARPVRCRGAPTWLWRPKVARVPAGAGLAGELEPTLAGQRPSVGEQLRPGAGRAGALSLLPALPQQSSAIPEVFLGGKASLSAWCARVRSDGAETLL
eukprot:552532-Heterocapsa_arctica.AAC.1